MAIRDKLAHGYRKVEGGLFSSVTKADVGEGFAALEGEVTLMGWADPFYPSPSLPSHIKAAMVNALEGGFPAHYTMPIGNLSLRKAIARHRNARDGLALHPQRNVIITPGSDSGLYYALSLFINPGDEVLVPAPSYPNNFLDPLLLGGKVVPVPLDRENGWELNIAAFEKAISPKSKVVVLTHPNNPTTTVFSPEKLAALAALIVEHDLILVVDQAFEDTVFDDKPFLSPAILPNMWQRTLTVCSISKGMGLSGLRVGYIFACDEIMDVLYGAAVNVLGATGTAAQLGALAAFEDCSFMAEYMKKYDWRRKKAVEILGSVPGVQVQMPQSGFYCWVDVTKLGDSGLVSSHLLQQAKVAVNDGKAYGPGGEGHLRIVHGCLGSDDEAAVALSRLALALKSYPKL